MNLPTDKERRAELMCASKELIRMREQFVLSMGTLEQEIKRKLDWRRWVRCHPGTALAIAFTIGIAIGRKP